MVPPEELVTQDTLPAGPEAAQAGDGHPGQQTPEGQPAPSLAQVVQAEIDAGSPAAEDATVDATSQAVVPQAEPAQVTPDVPQPDLTQSTQYCDALTAAGVQHNYVNDAVALEGHTSLRTRLSERDELAEYGRRSLAEQTAQQQAAAQAQQPAAPQMLLGDIPAMPDCPQHLKDMVTFDAETGEYTAAPGAPLDAIPKVAAFDQWHDKHWLPMFSEPARFMANMDTLIAQRVAEQSPIAMQQHTAEQAYEKFLQDHRSELVDDSIPGQPKLNPLGNEVATLVNENNHPLDQALLFAKLKQANQAAQTAPAAAPAGSPPNMRMPPTAPEPVLQNQSLAEALHSAKQSANAQNPGAFPGLE